MQLEAQIEKIILAADGLAPNEQRHLIAIAGPPAAGKSTVAEAVQQRLETCGTPCGLVPMDGFHLDNETLAQRGLLHRKGAPETFDVDGFLALIKQLKSEQNVPVPLFDRAADCVRPNARQITPAQRLVVVEGNYLLLDLAKWRELAEYWSLTAFIAPPLETLKERLIARWRGYGLAPEAAEKRALLNDIPNAQLVIEKSRDGAGQLLLQSS